MVPAEFFTIVTAVLGLTTLVLNWMILRNLKRTYGELRILRVRIYELKHQNARHPDQV